MKYKIIDTQGGGLMQDDVFESKKEVRDRLVSFHSIDFTCEDCLDLDEHLNRQGFNTIDEEVDWLLEWGQWELEEVKTLPVKCECDELKVVDSFEELPKDVRAEVEQALSDDIQERYNTSEYHNEDIIHNTLADLGYKLKD